MCNAELSYIHTARLAYNREAKRMMKGWGVCFQVIWELFLIIFQI